MSEKSEVTQLLEFLKEIEITTDEYFSHQTALFLSGYLNDPPERLSIVSGRRRRNRKFKGYNLTFVYHGKKTSLATQTIICRGIKYTVSSVETTLIDLLKDSTHAPDLELIARLFCILPYDPRKIINAAKHVSDTVLKRVSIMLAWSGRIAYDELPLKSFKRTPIKLVPCLETEAIWNGLFFCSVPLKLLMIPVSPPPETVSEDIKQWMELRAMPEFCARQANSGLIFIRNTPDHKIVILIEDFFTSIFKKLSPSRLASLLMCQAGIDTVFTRIKITFPRLLIDFVNTHPSVLRLREKEIKEWLTINRDSKDLVTIECCVKLAKELKLDDMAIELFANHCTEFYYAERFDFIESFAISYCNDKFILPHHVYLEISRTYTALDKTGEALQLLEWARNKFSNLPDSTIFIGKLYYASALLFKNLGRSDEALAELFLARECFEINDDQENLARVECALGNLYFSRGYPDYAKKNYNSGLRRAKAIGHKNIQASFLANLGLVEYDLGNFTKACSNLHKAYELNCRLKNYRNASIAGIGLGKIYLKLGHFSKSMKIFREVLLQREKNNNPSGVYETSCLLAWICEVLGKNAAAKTYWDQSEQFGDFIMQARAAYVGESLKGMSLLFNHKFVEAERLFRLMLARVEQTSDSQIHIGECEHNLAACLLFMGKKAEALTYLQRSEKNICGDPDRLQLIQVQLMGALYFPDDFNHIDLTKVIGRYMKTRYFDPFWTFYADELFNSKAKNKRKFLHFLTSHTPPSMLRNMLNKFDNLEHILGQLEKSQNRSGEFYTIISTSETRTIHHEEYVKFKQSLPANHLIFDGPSGTIHFAGNTVRLKRGTIPHSVLMQLFMSIPHPAEIATLYESAWEAVYDPECDSGAFKSTVQRLKKLLRGLTPGVNILRKRSVKGSKGIKLIVSVPWMLVFK